jgi:hypothetical protein
VLFIAWMLTPIGAMIYGRVQLNRAETQARVDQAMHGAMMISVACDAFVAYTGGPPPVTLEVLTERMTNARGETLPSVLPTLPTPPPGWKVYTYTATTATVFACGKVTTSGDGQTVTFP